MEQTETVDLTQLQAGTPININNQLYCLGKPIIQADYFNQLISQIRMYSPNTPVVVVLPDYDGLDAESLQQNMSDFVNCFARTLPIDRRKLVSSRTMDKWSEQDIGLLSHGDSEVESVLYCARKHAACLADCEALEKEMNMLIHKQNQGMLTEDDKARGDLVYNTLLPNAKIACQRALDELKQMQEKCSAKALTKPSEDDNVIATDTAIERETPEIPAEIVQQSSAQSSVDVQISAQAPMPAQTQLTTADTTVQTQATIPTIAPSDDAVINGIRRVTFRWKTPQCYCMPLSLARSCVNRPEYVAYSAYQRPVEGYVLVPPELLILYGITMYTPDLPIVFTPLGEFRRVGESSRPILDINYWYPKPKYYHR